MRAFLVASTILASSLLIAAAPGRNGCWGGAPPPVNQNNPPAGGPMLGCSSEGKVLPELPPVGWLYSCGGTVEVVVDSTNFDEQGTTPDVEAESCSGTGFDSCQHVGTYQHARCYLTWPDGHADATFIKGAHTLDEAQQRCDYDNGVGTAAGAQDCVCRWYLDPEATKYVCTGGVTCTNSKNEYDSCYYNGWEVYADDEDDARDLLADFCEIDMHDKYGHNCDNGGMCCTPGSLTCWPN